MALRSLNPLPNSSPSSALKSPISVLLPKVPRLIRHVELSSSSSSHQACRTFFQLIALVEYIWHHSVVNICMLKLQIRSPWSSEEEISNSSLILETSFGLNQSFLICYSLL
ncbi:hypothetical protein ACSBR1_030008 [Camellia fascicularis]